MTTENQQLKQAGLKVTLPRLAILQVLKHSEVRHLSAEDVYKALLRENNDVGLATVYRVLTQFEDAGLVMRHNFDGGHSVFELATAEHHDHMVCNTCGQVFEFADTLIEEQQLKVAADLGFKLSGHSLHLYGVCQKQDCEHNKNR
jgi:Fur family ferric uptake transcriptional regulator